MGALLNNRIRTCRTWLLYLFLFSTFHRLDLNGFLTSLQLESQTTSWFRRRGFLSPAKIISWPLLCFAIAGNVPDPCVTDRYVPVPYSSSSSSPRSCQSELVYEQSPSSTSSTPPLSKSARSISQLPPSFLLSPEFISRVGKCEAYWFEHRLRFLGCVTDLGPCPLIPDFWFESTGNWQTFRKTSCLCALMAMANIGSGCRSAGEINRSWVI